MHFRPLATALYALALMGLVHGAEPTTPITPAAPKNDAAKLARASSGKQEAVELPPPADFAWTLQSVFGKESDAMAGFREKRSSQSLWVGKGAKLGDYRLESVDGERGVAILMKNGRRYRLALAAAEVRPTVDKVQNNALEKRLFNDARHIASAANQYFADKGVEQTTLGKLRQYFGDGIFHAGEQIGIRNNGSITFVDLTDKSSDDVILNAHDAFFIGSSAYEKSATENAAILPENTDPSRTFGGDHGIVFEVDTGMIVSR